MGSALSTFTAFMHATGPTYLTSADSVLNEAAKRNTILGRMIRGKDKGDLIQGGSKIKDVIMFDDASTYTHYQPNDTFTWQNPQVTTEQEVNWRFSLDHMTWTDQEILLNVPDGLTKAAQKVQYKRIKKIKEQRMWTSMINGMENDLWANPANQQAQMESSTGTLPYSIPAFVNENASGLPTGWTTVMGINPASESRWVPQQVQYDYADPYDADGDRDGLFNAFDNMYTRVMWEPIEISEAKSFFEASMKSAKVICCSRDGFNLYKDVLRNSNDQLVAPSRQDPAYNNPLYSGIEVKFIDTLTTAALYGSATESAATTPGPRFYFLDLSLIKPVMHSNRFFHRKDLPVHPNQPFTNVVPVDCWWNVFCRSRQRLGIVYPGA